MTSVNAPSSRTVTPPIEAHAAPAGKETLSKSDPEQPAPAISEKPQGFTFPDGGWKAWSTVAGAWLILFCSFGYINAFGELL